MTPCKSWTDVGAQSKPIPSRSVLHFMLSSYGGFTTMKIPPNVSEAVAPDHPLLLNYVAYHHYRALGWVVKTGIKFCTDWLLYKRGMVFSHAE